MLKILAICAMAFGLIVLQASGQPHKTQEANNSQKPTSPVPSLPMEKKDRPSLKDEANRHIDADVRVTETPGKDAYDKAAFWISAALAGVGVIGIVVGICTLVYLRRQAGEMRLQRKVMVRTLLQIKRQSDMTERQTAFIISKERGRLEIVSGGIEVEGEEDWEWWLVGNMRLQNAGQANIYILRSGGEIIVRDIGDDPPTEEPTRKLPELDIAYRVIRPIDRYRVPFFSEKNLHSMLEFSQMIVEVEAKVIIRGFVEYETLGSVWHRDFAYGWISDSPYERAKKISTGMQIGGAPPNAIEQIQDGRWMEDSDDSNTEYEITQNPN